MCLLHKLLHMESRDLTIWTQAFVSNGNGTLHWDLECVCWVLKLIFFFQDLPPAGTDKRSSWAQLKLFSPFSHPSSPFLMPPRWLDSQPCIYRVKQIWSCGPAVTFYFVWTKARRTLGHGLHGTFASDFNHTACNDSATQWRQILLWLLLKWTLWYWRWLCYR